MRPFLKKIVVLLFDLDGVLIKPGGYRAASRDTLDYFVQKMGIDVHLPGEDIFSRFESAAITNEWDMVPLTLCSIMNEVSFRARFEHARVTFDDFKSAARKTRLGKIDVNYSDYIRGFGSALQPGVPPSQAVLEAELKGQTPRIFAGLEICIVKQLLGATRDIHRSPTTRVFQQYILGSEKFTHNYSLQADLDTPSYLLVHDQGLLSEPKKALLEKAIENRMIFCAGLTLRPSLPEGTAGSERAVYSPETSLARQVIGWEDLPIIGYGDMCWLGETFGKNEEALIKPAPTQALCAVGCASGLDLTEAFMWSLELESGKGPSNHNIPTDLKDMIEIHVFEDSTVGIKACQHAAQLMSSHYKVELHCHGIGEHVQKAQALRAAGAVVEADINQALQKVFSDIGA